MSLKAILEVIQFSCVAENETGGLCRHSRQNGGRHCTQHQKMLDEGKEVKQPRKPDVVMVKFDVTPDLEKALDSLGIPIHDQSIKQKQQTHVAHAESLGRSATAYGKIDSGTAPWGTDPRTQQARKVPAHTSILFKELLAQYPYLHAHVQRNQKPPYWNEQRKGPWLSRGVINFATEKPENFDESVVSGLIDFLDREVFVARECEPYVNSPRPDKLGKEKILHSFKVGRRMGSIESEDLPEVRFGNGEWILE